MRNLTGIFFLLLFFSSSFFLSFEKRIKLIINKIKGTRVIVAVDVGSSDDTDPFDYGDFLNGWLAVFFFFDILLFYLD